MSHKNPDLLKARMRVLSQRHTWEIIACLGKRELYLKEIAIETGIPYTTVQKRINDMKRCSLVKLRRGSTLGVKRYVNMVKVRPFIIHLNSRNIVEEESA